MKVRFVSTFSNNNIMYINRMLISFLFVTSVYIELIHDSKAPVSW